MIRCYITGKEKIFLSSPHHSTVCGTHKTSQSSNKLGSFPGVKQSEGEATHTPPPDAEFRKKYSDTSTPCTRMRSHNTQEKNLPSHLHLQKPNDLPTQYKSSILHWTRCPCSPSTANLIFMLNYLSVSFPFQKSLWFLRSRRPLLLILRVAISILCLSRFQ